MQLTFPHIRLVNKELKDPAVYLNEELSETQFDIEFSVNLDGIGQKEIGFFIHIAIKKSKNEDEQKLCLLQTDYLLLIGTDTEINKKEKIKIDKEELAHFLGMGIIMIRGSLMTMLQYHPLDGFTLPIMNPMKILQDSFEEEGGNIVLRHK